VSGSHSRWSRYSSGPQSRWPAAARRAWAISYQGSRARASPGLGLAWPGPTAARAGASSRPGSGRIAALADPDLWLPPGMARAPPGLGGAPGTGGALGAAGRFRTCLRGKGAGGLLGACRAGPPTEPAAARPAAADPAEAGPGAAGPPAVGPPAVGPPAVGRASVGRGADCGSSGQGGPGRVAGHAGRPAGRPSAVRESAGSRSAGSRSAGNGTIVGGLNDGRAAAASIRRAAGGQPSSRRCRPLVAVGPVGRVAA
jgi:hypothetical protein